MQLNICVLTATEELDCVAQRKGGIYSTCIGPEGPGYIKDRKLGGAQATSPPIFPLFPTFYIINRCYLQ